jgi:aromatic ring hydroxylase
MPIRTGADYIKDGREIWNAGRRIEDVTKHSGLRERYKLSQPYTTSNTSLNTAI